MTTYAVWPEGWRKNEDAAYYEAADTEEAVMKACNDLWYIDGTVNKSAWIHAPKNVFCQAEGDDSARLYSVAVNIEPTFYVEEV